MSTFSEEGRKVNDIWEALAADDSKKWARPDAPVLHTLPDEKSEPLVFWHNTNYRISRKYINAEKAKLLEEQAKVCMRTSGHARHHKCVEIMKRFEAAVRVASNTDRGPLARKRDVGFVYHNARMKQLQQEAKELGVDNPFAPPARNS